MSAKVKREVEQQIDKADYCARLNRDLNFCSLSAFCPIGTAEPGYKFLCYIFIPDPSAGGLVNANRAKRYGIPVGVEILNEDGDALVIGG